MRRAVGAGLLALVLLTGCASSPEAELNQAVSDLTERANAQDAPGVRVEAQQLIDLVNRQSGDDLSPDKASRIRDAASRVLADAALLEAPTPTPTPSASPTPTPSRTPSRTPTPTPTPSESPSPTPTPSQPPSPTPSRTPSRTPSATPTPTPSDEARGDGGDDGGGTTPAVSPSAEVPDA